MAEPLPLYPGAQPCQRSGWCCEQGPCQFGVWDADRKKCASLSYDADGRARCNQYDEILALPQGQWFFSPAFGAGCCSPLNPKRRR